MFPPTWIARAVSDAPPSTLTVPSTRVPSSSQLASCGTRRLSTIVAPMAPRHSASPASAAAGVSAAIRPARVAAVRSLLVHMLRCAQLRAGSRMPPPLIAVELERQVRRAGSEGVDEQAHDFAGHPDEAVTGAVEQATHPAVVRRAWAHWQPSLLREILGRRCRRGASRSCGCCL